MTVQLTELRSAPLTLPPVIVAVPPFPPRDCTVPLATVSVPPARLTAPVTLPFSPLSLTVRLPEDVLSPTVSLSTVWPFRSRVTAPLPVTAQASSPTVTGFSR